MPPCRIGGFINTIFPALTFFEDAETDAPIERHRFEDEIESLAILVRERHANFRPEAIILVLALFDAIRIV